MQSKHDSGPLRSFQVHYTLQAASEHLFRTAKLRAKQPAKVGQSLTLGVSRAVPGVVLGCPRVSFLAKRVLSLEKVNPSISNDPTVFFTTFGIP